MTFFVASYNRVMKAVVFKYVPSWAPVVVTLGHRCYTSQSKVTLPFWQTTSPFASKTPNSHLCHQITSKSNSLPDGCVFISVIVGDYLVRVVLTVSVNLSSHFYKQTADGWSWKSESWAFLGTLTLSHDLFPFFVYWKRKKKATH